MDHKEDEINLVPSGSVTVKTENENKVTTLTKTDNTSNTSHSAQIIMAGVGNLEAFDLSNPSKWTSYLERFKLFLLANDVKEEERKKAAFLTLAGAPLYDLLTSLASPKQVSALKLDEIEKILTDHLSPRPSEIAAFFHFHKRDQQPDESVGNYMAALRTLAVNCNFGTALDRMLRDRFVCGMKDESLQKNFLAETELTVQKVMERAITSEAAAISAMSMRHTSELHHNDLQHDEYIHEVKAVRSREQYQQRSFTSNHNRGPCAGCGGQHFRKQCPHRETVCHSCGLKGHLQRVCRSANSSSSATSVRQARQSINQILPLISQKKSINIIIKGCTCTFEVDSGSPVTIMKEATFNQICIDGAHLSKCNLNFNDYQGNPIPVMGVMDVSIQYNRRKIDNLPLVITSGTGSNLLGCNWFDALGIRIEGIHAIKSEFSIKVTLDKFKHLFSAELGRFTGPPVSLHIDSSIPPVKLPPRQIPFAIKGLYEEEIDRLCSQGILEPVEYSEWATPTVPVIKKDGSIRICGDYKSTLNRAIVPHCHQIPAVNTLLASIEGGSIFAKIDLAQAYQQLVVDERSALLQTISTHRGAFKVTRLQFGVSSAPAIFQSCIENILQNISGVLPYFDDIIVMGKSEKELAERLHEVLSRFDKAGLRLRKEKCQFGVPSVEFLGFKIDALGIRPSADKVKAIHNAPAPKDKKQLQAFLGLINFYHAFLPHKATIAEPLHRLLDKNAHWSWNRQHEEAFRKLKTLIASEDVLIHYDEKLPLVLTCDASPYGLGAVLSHKLADSSEKPIAFYSRTLTKAERNYAHIDREAVALVAGVQKFHNYLYGRRFTLVTDHQPLLGIFRTKKSVPNVISNQMLHRAIFLNAYDFELLYRAGTRISNADFLSRCPIVSKVDSSTEEVLMIELAASPVVTAQHLASQTSKDPELSKVLNYVLRGWPNAKIDRASKLYPFYLRRNELTATRGVLVWGNRTVIPPPAREAILAALHAPHPGIVKMKAVARSYVWWPNIDAEIELVVKRCTACQQNRHEQPHAPTHHWESAKRPWIRLHVDFAGPFQGKTFVLVVDSYSKWLEVAVVSSTSAAAAIKFLRQLFASHGLPDELVSDNGPAFSSDEFKSFIENNLIRHIRCAPFHPASNGQVERMVQSTKDYLKKLANKTNIDLKLARYVFNQHTTPHATTNHSPAHLLFNRELRTYFDKIQPQEITFGKTCDQFSAKRFVTGNPVWVRNYAAGPKWMEGVVSVQTGPVSYSVHLNDSRLVKRHQDQLRSRVPQSPADDRSDEANVEAPSDSNSEDSILVSPVPTDHGTPKEHAQASVEEFTAVAVPSPTAPAPAPTTPRRTGRKRKAPQFYNASGC